MIARRFALLILLLLGLLHVSRVNACTNGYNSQPQALTACENFIDTNLTGPYAQAGRYNCVIRGNQYQISDPVGGQYIGNFLFDPTCPVAQANYPEKNLGSTSGCACGDGEVSIENEGSLMVSDPINASTGNKYLQENDYIANPWLTFRRFYNSNSNVRSTAMGVHWRHSFDRSLVIFGTPTYAIVMFRPDGRQVVFTKVNGQWASDPDVSDTLAEIDDSQGIAAAYTVFIASLRHTETYNPNGLLQSVMDANGTGINLTYSTTQTPSATAPIAGLLLTVTDTSGRQLNFNYNSTGHIHQVILPDGGRLTYAYNNSGLLSSIQYPDSTMRQYIYNESSLTGGVNLPYAMTGVVDETGARYQSTTFDSTGRATSSSLSGNVGATSITYQTGASTVQYPLGNRTTLTFSTVQGVNKVASLNLPCGQQCAQPWQTRTYDINGYPSSATNWNGNITKTTYYANGLLGQQIDASSTPSQRTTNFTWNPTLRIPQTWVVLNASGTTVSSTRWIYNAAGQTVARCEIDPTNSTATSYACSASGTVPAEVRRWTYTYCTAVDTTQCPLVGLLLTATGPRTDVAQTTTYSYYLDSATSGCTAPGGTCHQPGDLHTVTDPSGHVTTVVSYDADGRITRETDANGINTDLTYTPRGWLASRTVGGAQTTFGYTPYGAVSSVTDPDGVVISYGYDAAHRLVKITDAQGNYLQYTLDAAGNKTSEQVFDSSGTAHQSLSRTFNPLGQLTTVVDGLSHTVFNASAAGSYDANGNLAQSSDGLGIQRQASYDAFNRLVQTIDNYNGTN